MTSHPPREFRFRPFRRVRKLVLSTKRPVKRPVRLLTLQRTKKRRVAPTAFHQMISTSAVIARALQRREKLIFLLKVTRRGDVPTRRGGRHRFFMLSSSVRECVLIDEARARGGLFLCVNKEKAFRNAFSVREGVFFFFPFFPFFSLESPHTPREESAFCDTSK